MRIPYGKVASYKELAESAGYPNAWRAAGTAISKNPVMIVVPCHRIIKSDGSIGLYGGGEKVKEFLLDLEQD
jgi:O-6-methylguanine DNA methyltransferase